MTIQNYYSDYYENYEYHGNTAVEITLVKKGVTIKRDWIFFDSVQEAQDFFMKTIVIIKIKRRIPCSIELLMGCWILFLWL